ncbi:MAG: hypothetical protein ABI723_19885 [Bacteroidia bacterium]
MQCPRCNNYTFRIKRKTSDRLFDAVTLGILAIKRYKCFYCYWEGRVSRNHELKFGKGLHPNVNAEH